MTLDEILGAYACGLKYPLNWLGIIGADPDRKEILKRNRFGLASGDPLIVEVLDRIKKPGRGMHDRTTLPIDQMRWAFKTWENADRKPTIGAWMVKRYFAMFVYGQIALALIGGLGWLL